MTARNKMDYRLLTLRRKTIRELKPNYWWDADFGVTSSGGLVSSWVDRIAGLAVAQDTDGRKPTFARYGLSQRSCLIFDGGDTLFANSCPMAAWTAFTILVQFQMLGVDTSASHIFFAACQSSDPVDSHLRFGTSGVTGALASAHRNDTANVGARGTTAVNVDAERHVAVFTQSAALDKHVIYCDGLVESLTVTTDAGQSFPDVTGLDVCSIGAMSAAADSVDVPASAKIAQVVMWNKVL